MVDICRAVDHTLYECKTLVAFDREKGVQYTSSGLAGAKNREPRDKIKRNTTLY